MNKAKAGVALLSAQWFVDVGLQGDASARQRELSRMVQGDLTRIREALEPHFALVDPGLISSLQQAERAVRMFLGEGAELVILIHVMWSEDPPLVRLLRGLQNLPVVVWCYNPYDRLPEHMSLEELFRASGSVGFLQGSVPLRLAGIGFSYLFGSPDNPDLRRELAELSRVFSVYASLRRLRVGRIGPRCEAMTGTYVEEFRLTEDLGVSLVPLPASRLSREARALQDAGVDSFVAGLKERYRIEGVSDRALREAARASLAVAAVAEQEDLGAVAIEDLHPELHELLGTRPCLWVPSLRERGVVVGMEADVLSTLGMWLARNLGETTPMYTEVFTYDERANCLLLGHAAMHDPALAGDNGITIIPDREYEISDPVEGAWMHFAARPGAVTLVNLSGGAGAYRLFCVRGEALPTQGKLAGYAHALVRIEPPLAVFFEQAARLGMMQHFSMSYDEVSGRLERLSRVAGIEFRALTAE
jgi:L-fucose isomerase-like protein